MRRSTHDAHRLQHFMIGDERRALTPQASRRGKVLAEEAVLLRDIPNCGCRTDWELSEMVVETPGLPARTELAWRRDTTHRQICKRLDH